MRADSSLGFTMSWLSFFGFRQAKIIDCAIVRTRCVGSGFVADNLDPDEALMFFAEFARAARQLTSRQRCQLCFKDFGSLVIAIPKAAAMDCRHAACRLAVDMHELMEPSLRDFSSRFPASRRLRLVSGVSFGDVLYGLAPDNVAIGEVVSEAGSLMEASAECGYSILASSESFSGLEHDFAFSERLISGGSVVFEILGKSRQ